ncbi:MAG: hypothetical protein HYW01_02070 [Deltaproteobacteria bacterium]|nr:hypothetical protein [Deltaproteobacteria bacterium]
MEPSLTQFNNSYQATVISTVPPVTSILPYVISPIPPVISVILKPTRFLTSSLTGVYPEHFDSLSAGSAEGFGTGFGMTAVCTLGTTNETVVLTDPLVISTILPVASTVSPVHFDCPSCHFDPVR